jgi:hypothetical protein
MIAVAAGDTRRACFATGRAFYRHRREIIGVALAATFDQHRLRCAN